MGVLAEEDAPFCRICLAGGGALLSPCGCAPMPRRGAPLRARLSCSCLATRAGLQGCHCCPTVRTLQRCARGRARRRGSCVSKMCASFSCLLAARRCKGSGGHVHVECLRRWQARARAPRASRTPPASRAQGGTTIVSKTTSRGSQNTLSPNASLETLKARRTTCSVCRCAYRGVPLLPPLPSASALASGLLLTTLPLLPLLARRPHPPRALPPARTRHGVSRASRVRYRYRCSGPPSWHGARRARRP